MKQRGAGILVLALVLFTRGAIAQLSPVTIPRGLFRIELGGEFRNADSRYHDGATEDLARSWTATPFGSSVFPSLAASETAIGAITRNPNYRISLGSTTANGLMNIGTASIGISYGLTSRITLFTTVPIVQTRMQLSLRMDTTTADAGFNPADPILGTPAGQGQTALFFSQFDAALSTLAAKIANGDYNGNPADLALAQDALAQGTALRSGFALVFTDPESPFVPTASSATGQALSDTVTTFQTTLNTLNVTGFSTGPALAANAITPDEFTNFLINPAGPVRGFPLNEARLNLLGDIEGSVSYLLADRWNRDGRMGGFRATLTGTVRFPTGQVERPENFLDIGTGAGHVAARITGTVDLGRGRLGARMAASYEHAFAATLDQRVGGPFEPIRFFTRQTSVRRTPGSTVDLSLAPFYRLTPSLALLGGVRLRQHSADDVELAGDSATSVPASLLAEETDWSLLAFQAGVTYMAPAALDPTRPGFPVEANWTIEGPLSGSGGIVAKERVMRVQLRMYLRLFN